jgi:hypothetical protein
MLQFLLKVDANVNIEDRQRNPVLHLISRTECLYIFQWKTPTYLLHAEVSTSTGKLNHNWKLPWRPMQELWPHSFPTFPRHFKNKYPNVEFCNLLDKYFSSIKSLSCLSTIIKCMNWDSHVMTHPKQFKCWFLFIEFLFLFHRTIWAVYSVFKILKISYAF